MFCSLVQNVLTVDRKQHCDYGSFALEMVIVLYICMLIVRKMILRISLNIHMKKPDTQKKPEKPDTQPRKVSHNDDNGGFMQGSSSPMFKTKTLFTLHIPEAGRHLIYKNQYLNVKCVPGT